MDKTLTTKLNRTKKPKNGLFVWFANRNFVVTDKKHIALKTIYQIDIDNVASVNS